MVRNSGSNQPLGAGNVVSASLRLYGANLKSYLKIAGIAVLWGLLPFVAMVLIIIVAALAGRVTWLLLIPWIGLLLYCVAKTLTNMALISRLAFGELAEQPETIEAARSEVNKKMWGFLIVGVLVYLLLVAVNLGVGIVQGILVGIVSGVFGRGSVIASLVALIVQLVGLGIYLWFVARWYIPEVVLAVEDGVDSTRAIGRSWELSKGYAGKVLVVLLVASLITLPFYILAGLPIVLAVIPLALQGGIPDPAFLQPIFNAFAIFFLILFGISIFIAPFWQTTKALIYLDLRSRKEGLGLQLRDRNEPQV
ncbi:hypothetical protein K9N68_22380 [Kovacikia minuta CCNUW1]|uniref:hypothetical protein n=1 Tax=Kovacikia minuta TaxID=2931930 RepID=UPI001CCEF6AE|nr:hypothetical protein [Kovacikia minuta]UBF24428.1 hypothetical protein K9N68_22380 [Kovacikia minuta CCNUW1]